MAGAAGDSDGACLSPLAFALRATAERRSLLRMLRRLLPAREDAEDILQDALLYAYRNLRALRRPEAFGAWLRTIAYHRAMQWHRMRNREEGTRPHLWSPGEVDREQRRTELRTDVHAVLELLSPADRRLIALRYEEDRDPTEIAAMLKIAARTVRVRLHRARKAFRTAYLDVHRGGHR